MIIYAINYGLGVVGPKLVHVCFKQNIAQIVWKKKEIVNAYN